MRDVPDLIVGDPTTGAIVAIVTAEPSAEARRAAPTMLRPNAWTLGAAALAGLVAVLAGVAHV